MITFSAHTQWKGDNSAIISAHSKRCRYTVTITGDSVVLQGPGVLQEYDRKEDLPDFDSLEALAITAILTFEEA